MDENEYITAMMYDPSTGMIFASRSGTKRSIDMEPLPYIVGDYDIGTNYVNLTQSPPAITPRPSMPITQDRTTITADGDEVMTLSGLPIPCTVRIKGNVYDVPDGVLEWATLMPATYPITVEAFPYLNWEGEVTANASDVQTE